MVVVRGIGGVIRGGGEEGEVVISSPFHIPEGDSPNNNP